MREQASQFVSYAVMLLTATSACASTGKAIHKPLAARHAEARVIAARKPAPSHQGRPLVVARIETSRKPLASVAHASGSRAPAVQHRPAPVVRAQREAPEPVRNANQEQEEIHVTHDRKRHYSAEPSATVRVPRRNSPVTVVATQPEAPALIAAPRLRPAMLPSEPAPAISPVLYDRRGRLIVPAAMKGSHEILVHQNVMADQDGLDRVRDDDDLLAMREGKLLVAIPAVAGLQQDERLPLNRRFCRPWTAQFLTALARAHYAKFHSTLQVNSAVRTVEFQQRLLLTNGNAAPAEGETASPHLTGQAIDLAKKGLSMTEIAWMRGYLLPLVQSGKIDVEEEFQQACFHISVYRNYLPEAAPKREIAQTRHVSGAALAAAIR